MALVTISGTAEAVPFPRRLRLTVPKLVGGKLWVRLRNRGLARAKCQWEVGLPTFCTSTVTRIEVVCTT